METWTAIKTVLEFLNDEEPYYHKILQDYCDDEIVQLNIFDKDGMNISQLWLNKKNGKFTLREELKSGMSFKHSSIRHWYCATVGIYFDTQGNSYDAYGRSEDQDQYDVTPTDMFTDVQIGCENPEDPDGTILYMPLWQFLINL